MKKSMMTGLVLCIVLSIFVAPVVSALAASTISGSAKATVPQFLELNLLRGGVVRMEAGKDSDPWNDGTVLSNPTFDFGLLSKVSDSEGNVLYMEGKYFYYLMMMATTSGRRYKITETGTTFTNSSNGTSLPKGSVLLIPDYQWLDQIGGGAQGTPPSGATVGRLKTACDANSVVYQSDSLGLSRIVRAIVGIGGPTAGNSYPQNYSLGHNGSAGQGALQEFTQWEPITPQQGSGDYQGTLRFTLVLN